ncbi:MAG: hypothetical protein QF437_19660, partial [Planctomycetota bacterium]|nr:hypothetical protein [Planctomycetota bacterium]
EHERAAEEGASILAHLAHKTPYYPILLERGLSGVIADIEAKLANEKFISRAPADVVQRERRRLASLRTDLQTVEEALRALQ